MSTPGLDGPGVFVFELAEGGVDGEEEEERAEFVGKGVGEGDGEVAFDEREAVGFVDGADRALIAGDGEGALEERVLWGDGVEGVERGEFPAAMVA